jgi:hypothetical protein
MVVKIIKIKFLLIKVATIRVNNFSWKNIQEISKL